MEYKFNITISTHAEDSVKAREQLLFLLKSLDLKVIEIENVEMLKTDKQTKALHLWFQLLADELNDKSFDMRGFLKESVKMDWSAYAVKEYIFKPLLKQRTGKDSTKKMFRNEINALYDTINREIIERTKGVVICPPFPCQEWREEEINNIK